MVLVHQFSNAENKLILRLWVSHRLKQFSCTDTVFVCVRGQRVVLLLIDEISENVDSTLSAAQGRAH